jgi:hypothetical protein
MDRMDVCCANVNYKEAAKYLHSQGNVRAGLQKIYGVVVV